MKKILLITLIFICNLYALKISSSNVKNANTVFLEIQKENISDVKLTFDKQNINFFKNPFKENSYYALLPISYYQKQKEYRVIVSYIENGKKVFKGKNLKVVDGKYKSEVINVPKTKFKPKASRVQRTKKEYSQAMKVYKSISKEILWNEDFIYPLNTKITSNFGTKRVYNGKLKSYHSGTDFRAKNGTAIIASNAGIVKISQNRFYSGGTIVIDHGHGVYSCYFHLSKMNYKVGESIKKGAVLGLSGDTGRVTGPHLHFSFRINGLQVDPLNAIEVLNKVRK
ncbi:M23 family metallopeptidase [Poseidonibacter ostreae]|jgi:murein DD-endopeptidase MepM/ murein hydrolase activator NlpD|uniref:Peptidoglycan DD-metalloendopeptidase family protein n=1 Tax=Poseidonibacter ostreae TaxID=2654171 RepID=A0A6L4WQ83_9BACT|nr:M23 family metallopeptidase [Poseidonibacter ostreae]KAB7882037.1 peptidoglycan DD-metalloendopeptidase family protein [Poseidonibacter ostreae]KAB7886630.1 peptidoglycan DD-metalloendopeptidase family protein [Poseidonibacter ostreae]KAB7889240.1 peptidoglycan DD-metalloendopeptidase family protein [Poseidonibacter ostreae]